MNTVIITGGSSGLGAAIKMKLQAAGDHVTDWSRETAVDITDHHTVHYLATKFGM
jgi:NAD(P)-dependent dehydrogenase (short-subunit alcohol dehydrogenase family)